MDNIKDNAQGGKGIITKKAKLKVRLEYADAGTTGKIVYLDRDDHGHIVTHSCNSGDVIEIDEECLKTIANCRVPVYKEFDGVPRDYMVQNVVQTKQTRPRFIITRA